MEFEQKKKESAKYLTLSPPHSGSIPIIKEYIPSLSPRLQIPNTKCTSQFNSNNIDEGNSNDISNDIDNCNSKLSRLTRSSNSLVLINECPGGDKCLNLSKIEKLMNKIKKLKTIIEDTNQLNSYFVYNLNLKDNLYKSLLQENNSIKHGRFNSKDIIHFRPSNRGQIQTQQVSNVYSPQNSIEKKKKKISVLAPLTNIIFNANSDLKHRIPQSSTQIISFFKKDQKRKKQIPSILNSNYYENIMNLSNKTSKHQLHTVSYLSMSIDKLKEVFHNENMEFIKSLTQSEDYFVSKLRGETKEYLVSFNEYLRNLIKDYKQIINLIVRIKQFISSNLDLVHTLFTSNSAEVLLDSTCKLLDCERAMVYLYDPISDMLQVFSGGNLRKAPSKISKTKGIIGRVFQKGEKIKIDDTLQDARFKKEDECKDKNFKIRNLLCYPLIDKQGATFGGVQAINKKDKFFNNDDEEFMTIFTKVASAVLNSKTNNDINIRQISRLEKIIKYSNDIRAIQDRDKLMERTEYVLNSLFNSGRSQFVLVVNGELIHYSRKFPKVDNIGIVYLVIKKRECHGCSKVKRCKYYNSLVDVDASDSLITYPVIYNDECIAVAQVSLTEKISEVTQKPKEREIQLFNLIQSCVIEWHLDNKDGDSVSSA